MGCDIHLFIEMRRHPENEWEAEPTTNYGENDSALYPYGVRSVSRNYHIFGLLAGVRENNCMFMPRGIPKDVTPLVEMAIEGWNRDAHTHSYLSLAEFKEVIAKTDYKNSKNTSTEINYDYSDPKYDTVSDFPENWTTIVNYCENWIDSENAESILLGMPCTAEIRLIFFFDS